MKPLEHIKINTDWLRDETLQTVFDVLTKDGAETRVAGGAVRNALMDEAVTDIDLCTTLLPTEVIKRIEQAGMKAIPTGIEHGTITVVNDKRGFEVTTIREDIETDGRHAVVRFGKDWERDAQRRDLTINALYCDREGNVFDYVNGYTDIEKREVRFIGDASERIKEDALRILRFFRFFAQYGSGRPNASGLKACAANKEFAANLSANVYGLELKKLLSAKDPSRALLWMRTTGVLNIVMPETEKWGIDTVPALMRVEQEEGWHADGLLRLMSVVRPHIETVRDLGKRLSLSNKELQRLEDWAQSTTPQANSDQANLAKMLYRYSKTGIIDAMRIEAAKVEPSDDKARFEELIGFIEFAENWQSPDMPIQGRDLIEAGMNAGPDMGKTLARLKEIWIESDFQLTREELMKL